MGFVMPLFQLESNTLGSLSGLTGGALTSCEHRNQPHGNGNGFKPLSLASSVNQQQPNIVANSGNNTRLNSSQKVNTTNENLHLSSALSEVNFKPPNNKANN